MGTQPSTCQPHYTSTAQFNAMAHATQFLLLSILYVFAIFVCTSYFRNHVLGPKFDLALLTLKDDQVRWFAKSWVPWGNRTYWDPRTWLQRFQSRLCNSKDFLYSSFFIFKLLETATPAKWCSFFPCHTLKNKNPGAIRWRSNVTMLWNMKPSFYLFAHCPLTGLQGDPPERESPSAAAHLVTWQKCSSMPTAFFAMCSDFFQCIRNH